MSETVELVLVRHGESVRNYACDLAREGQASMLEIQMREEQDEATWPLTELGHEQAARAGNWIRDVLGNDFQAAYVSTFLRARQTAEGLGLGLNWQPDERIREREWGDYEAAGFPKYTVHDYLTDLAICAQPGWKSPYPGAESVWDMVPRVTDFLRTALTATKDGCIIAVSHGGTIRSMQMVLEHIHPGEKLAPDRRLSNCCVVMYRLSNIDLDRMSWTGDVRTAHPALPDVPETAWEPLGGSS